MDFTLVLTNLYNPTILFFILGIIAIWIKSDLEIPPSSSKFISLYLLLSIGFKGGQELAHEHFSFEVGSSLLFGCAIALVIPLYIFHLLRTRLNIYDSAAVAACYGSVSAVTFAAGITFLEAQQMNSDGHMVAIMALMEAPAIVMGMFLMRRYDRSGDSKSSMFEMIKHSLTNGSVLLILGSLIIGIVADSKQAEGIKPFTNDIFKGFLAIFLLEMGMLTAKRFAAFRKYGFFIIAIALILPVINGIGVALCSKLVTDSDANRFMFAVLAASASFIAVPAAMRISNPKSDPGLYLPMSLGLNFPFNITLGMPIYYYVIQLT
jgi:hypothetical protein